MYNTSNFFFNSNVYFIFEILIAKLVCQNLQIICYKINIYHIFKIIEIIEVVTTIYILSLRG